jgi:radical SAM superfamily enzyme YgiQ (UPF0313 family)
MRAYQIADRFRSQGTPVVLGGVHPSLLPQEAIQHADAVVVGEAENLWPEILSDFEAGRLKALYTCNERPDLNNLVIQKWDNFNLSIYRRSIGYRMPRMPLFTTRGCLHNCKYCNIEMAADAGCKSMIFGIESINQQNLADIKKRFNQPEQHVELYKRCARAGIKPWYSMIFGLDHDTLETMVETADYLKKNRIWNVLFWILTPLPGTDLYQELSLNKRIVSRDWSKYDCSNVVFKPSRISADDLYANFWRIYQSFYTAPVMFQRVLDIYRNSKSPLKSAIQNIFYQIYFRKQISESHSPYSMGISQIP